mmetsp:Transcript_32056/g.60264  ORF Transcript_32056/g.60264 Transcript_32056/m.60264 type:complete len:338 (-) Transcript_32056:341-1354(-)
MAAITNVYGFLSPNRDSFRVQARIAHRHSRPQVSLKLTPPEIGKLRNSLLKSQLLHGNFDKTARFHGMRACADSNARRMVYSRGIADASAEGVSGKVVLTRELGKNDKMMVKLRALGLETIELPLIEHTHAEDTARLPETISAGPWDWVIITSPEGAKVFIDAWEKAGKPAMRIASVGEGTSAEFADISELEIGFEPSKATGVQLAAELPMRGPGERCMYAASAKAGSDVPRGLEERGFVVERLNTYSTNAVTTVDRAVLEAASQADVVTFGSPSTVKAWIQLLGDAALGPNGPKAACIGKTSAVASEKAGLPNIFFPEQPGIDGWVNSVLDALNQR